jgi:hypothetical protein
MAKKNNWGDDYEEMQRRSMLNLDPDGFSTNKTPGKKSTISTKAMSKAAMKGKDDSMRKQAMLAALRKKRKKDIPASPTK